MLQKEAKIVAEKMGNTDFKASNGWRPSFKKRHNIKQFAVSGETADIQWTVGKSRYSWSHL